MAHLATAIDLTYLGTIVQVHLGVLRPCINASASTINGAHACPVVGIVDNTADIHLGIEGAAFVVVTAKDSTIYYGIITGIIDVGLIDIARRKNMCTISTAKDILDFYSRTFGHIDYRSGCHTFVVTAAIGCAYLSVEQVNNCRQLVGVEFVLHSVCHFEAHTQTIVAAGTKDICIAEVG